MPHFAYSVRMVVGIGIYFRARGLSAGSMCMGHTRRLVGESINRTCDVVATEQVVLHTFRHAPFDVIIESLIDLSATAKNRNGTAGKRTPAVAGSIFGELARRKSGTTHKAVTVIVALHKHGRTGRRILTRILPLQGQPSQTVVQIIHIGNVIQIGSARAVKHPESTDVVLHDLHRILHLIDLKNYPNIQDIAYLMLG